MKNTARMKEGFRCGDCGYPIIEACCNKDFHKGIGDCSADYWVYCTNKGCCNHPGENPYSGCQIPWIKKEVK